MQIDNIASINGRLLLQDIFHKLRFEHQRPSISTLLILWRICISVSSTEVNQYIKTDITILHKLGFISGTRLWLEEIVNRYYFSTFNSLVYFGAAILLVLVGINRFAGVDNSFVLYGIAFEAVMLLGMFLIMIFTPNDDVNNLKAAGVEEDLERELLSEIGEISRDFAVTSTQLEKITNHLLELNDRQIKLSETLEKIANINQALVAPNPQMLDIMKEVNSALSDFKSNIIELNQTTKELKQEEIQLVVRKELEQLITKIQK